MAISLAVPAVLAGLAYLDARYSLEHDLRTLSIIRETRSRLRRRDRADQLNLFYQLEFHARSERATHVWLIFEGRSWTYAHAYDVVLRYGAWLRSKGARKDDVVALYFANSPLLIWLWYGLWSIGAKPAFIQSDCTGKTLVHSIKTSSASLVLVHQDGRDHFDDETMRESGFVPLAFPPPHRAEHGFEQDESETSKRSRSRCHTSLQVPISAEAEQQPIRQQRRLEIIFLDDSLVAHIQSFPSTRSPDSARSNQKQSSMGMLTYTSGTTGLPKPVAMSWARLQNASDFVDQWLSLEKEVMYTPMPLYHSTAAVLGVCATLQAGSTLCLSRNFSHSTFWPEIRASNATILHYVGELCRSLLAAPPSPLDKKHKIHAAFGHGLRLDIWEPFKERFGIKTIYELYAATEAPAMLWNSSSNSSSAGAIGRYGSLMSWLSRKSKLVVRVDPESNPMNDLLRDPSSGLCQECSCNETGELLTALNPNRDDINIIIKANLPGCPGNDEATEDGRIVRNVAEKGDAWLRSGDLVRRDKQGRWWFVDRLSDAFGWKAQEDDMVIISTLQVSETIGRHEAVQQASVYGVHVPRHHGRAVCAALVLEPCSSSSSSSSSAITTMTTMTTTTMTTPPPPPPPPDSNTAPLPTKHTLHSLASHMQKELPSFAIPIWLRITRRRLQATGTHQLQKRHLQQQGIDPRAAAASGDVLYWLSGDTYRAFTRRDWERIEGGDIKL